MIRFLFSFSSALLNSHLKSLLPGWEGFICPCQTSPCWKCDWFCAAGEFVLHKISMISCSWLSSSGSRCLCFTVLCHICCSSRWKCSSTLSVAGSGYPEQSNYLHFLPVCGVCVCVELSWVEWGVVWVLVCYHSHLNFHEVVKQISLGADLRST